VVKATVFIHALPGRVWAILTGLRSLADWDDLPDRYAGESLQHGSELVWNRIDGGYTKLTVTTCDQERRLRLSLYASHWEHPPAAYDIAYTYSLAAGEGGTLLFIEIGDFSVLRRGQAFFEASREFADRAGAKIKALAEE
jgi:uncharacterized protein YndB with AHSA1/START domain